MKRLLIVLTALLLLASGALAEEAAKLPIDLSGGKAPLMKYAPDLMVYEDQSIRVERGRVQSKEFTCTYYYAIVKVADASQLRTLPADNKDFCSSTRVSAIKMANRVRSVLAINGDFTASFDGNSSNSFILRQGKVYRGTVEPNLDVLLIDEDGDFHIIPAGPEQESMDLTTVDGKQVINAFQFGPALVVNGEKVSDEVLLDEGRCPVFAQPGNRNQRMAIAQIDHLTYMVVCCSHFGATLPTLRDIAMSIAPCQTVYNLDGGNSTQMIFLGKRVNSNNDGSEDRSITDIIYFATTDESGS